MPRPVDDKSMLVSSALALIEMVSEPWLQTIDAWPLYDWILFLKPLLAINDSV